MGWSGAARLWLAEAEAEASLNRHRRSHKRTDAREGLVGCQAINCSICLLSAPKAWPRSCMMGRLAIAGDDDGVGVKCAQAWELSPS